MTPEQFAYWLQGFIELNPDMPVPSAAQWQAIRDHLATVFVKVTPPVRMVGPSVASPATKPAVVGPVMGGGSTGHASEKALFEAFRRAMQERPLMIYSTLAVPFTGGGAIC